MFGRNAAAEIQVRELMPLDDLVEHLLAPALQPSSDAAVLTLRSNLMLVLNGAYLFTERRCRELDDCDDLVLLIAQLAGEIGAFVEDTLPDFGLGVVEDEEKLAQAGNVAGVLVPTLYTYYTLLGAPQGEEKERCDKVLAPQLKELFEIGRESTFNTARLDPNACAKLMEVLKVEGADKSAREAHAASESTRALLKTEAVDHHEAEPQEHTNEFFEEFYEEVKGGAEFFSLVEVFSFGVKCTIDAQRAAKAAKARQRQHAKKTTALTVDKFGTKYVKSLIDQLLALSADDEDEEHHHHQDTEQTVISLKVLTAVLESGDKYSPEDQHLERQLLLNSLGLATVAFKMAACVDDDLCRARSAAIRDLD